VERMRAVVERIAAAVTTSIAEPGNVIQITLKVAKNENFDSQLTVTVGATR